ncbi:MAG TPA: hypothetical protein VFZ61_25525 [Polyangiales bacterium]
MRRQRPQPLSLLLGLLALGWASACVAVMLGSENGSVGLSALSPPELVLMSCAADATAGYSALTSALGGDPSGDTPEPLWCENPESPHCQPGSPEPSHQQYSLGPVAVGGVQLPATRTSWLLRAAAGWSRPHDSQLVPTAPRQRLERPPRLS